MGPENNHSEVGIVMEHDRHPLEGHIQHPRCPASAVARGPSPLSIICPPGPRMATTASLARACGGSQEMLDASCYRDVDDVFYDGALIMLMSFWDFLMMFKYHLMILKEDLMIMRIVDDS